MPRLLQTSSLAPLLLAPHPNLCVQSEFQAKFWKLRQDEYERYLERYSPLRVRQVQSQILAVPKAELWQRRNVIRLTLLAHAGRFAGPALLRLHLFCTGQLDRPGFIAF